MDDLQIERLKSACVVMGEAASEMAARLRSFVDAMTAEAVGADPERDKWDEATYDPFADFLRAASEIESLAAYADDPADIPPPKKIPRPPKRLGPVNKENYAANRPLRMARSNCRNIKH